MNQFKFSSLCFFCVFFLFSCVNQTKNFDKEKATDARLNLGLAYLSENNLSKAYQNLKKAYDYSPNSSKVNLAFALYDEKIGDFESAKLRYLDLINKDPHEKNKILTHYARFLCKQGKADLAQESLKEPMQDKDYNIRVTAIENALECAKQMNDQEKIALFSAKLKDLKS